MSFDDLPPLNTSAEDLKALMDEMKESGAQLELEGAGPMGRETICLNNKSRLPAALFSFARIPFLLGTTPLSPFSACPSCRSPNVSSSSRKDAFSRLQSNDVPVFQFFSQLHALFRCYYFLFLPTLQSLCLADYAPLSAPEGLNRCSSVLLSNLPPDKCSKWAIRTRRANVCHLALSRSYYVWSSFFGTPNLNVVPSCSSHCRF